MEPLTEKEKEFGYHFWYRHYPWVDTEKEIEPFLKIEPMDESWLRLARQALFLTQEAMAAKLNVALSTYANFERREVTGTLTLKALKECAEAMDCQLIYAIVPKDKRRFSRHVWEKLIPAAQAHPWLTKCDQQKRACALAAMAVDVMRKAAFRRLNRPSPG